MADKSMYIPKENKQNFPFVDYNQWMKRLNTLANEPTNQNSIKFLKFFSQQKRKRYYRTLGISLIISPMSPPSLTTTTWWAGGLKRQTCYNRDLNPNESLVCLFPAVVVNNPPHLLHQNNFDIYHIDWLLSLQ